MDLLNPKPSDAEIEARLMQLVARHNGAGNLGIQILNLIGGRAEDLLKKLPAPMQDRLTDSTEAALRAAMGAAQNSRKLVGEQPAWLTKVLTTTMGAAGGFAGLPGAMAELPLTTTVLLRAMQDVAIEHGFDPEEERVCYDCIQLFASAGPLEMDDGADFAFVATRVAVTGAAINSLISRVAPRLGVVLGQKLAAQSVPVLGAAAGAATNYAYTHYYQQMAHVHFGLRRLAIEADQEHGLMLETFRDMAGQPLLKRAG